MVRITGCFCIVLGAWLTACGGKTDGGGTGGTAGAGGSGVGGTGNGGSGTGGVGNTGNVGGGGVGNVGGGGVGNTGNVGGGGSGGAPSDIYAKAEAICGKIQSLPCAPADCKQELGESIQFAFQHGCDAELVVLFDCLLAYDIYCAPGEPDPSIPIQCFGAQDAFEECVTGGDDCGGYGSSDGSCGFSCSNPPIGADCKPHPNGGLTCVCYNGQSFSLPGTCSSPGWEQAAKQICS